MPVTRPYLVPDEHEDDGPLNSDDGDPYGMFNYGMSQHAGIYQSHVLTFKFQIRIRMRMLKLLHAVFYRRPVSDKVLRPGR